MAGPAGAPQVSLCACAPKWRPHDATPAFPTSPLPLPRSALLRALLAAFRRNVLIMVAVKAAQILLGFAPPFILMALLTVLKSDSSEHVLRHGLLLALSFFLVALGVALLVQHFFWQGVLVALKVSLSQAEFA